MSIAIDFRILIEDQPGPDWRALCDEFWPGYRSWFLRGNAIDRPGYVQCRRALREHMPELVPTWERLVELAGGGDVESRFLSLWCPPPYIAGCSQAVWLDPHGNDEPALLRNYDFAPKLLEGRWLATRWAGQRVAALGDCLWGALDGINESGLTAALSFGGRKDWGSGFGIPLVLRYVLEVAQNTREAVRLLKRLPVSMTYTVTLLDSHFAWATVYLAPDRAPVVTHEKVGTNFQHAVEWPEHARATHAVERRDSLQRQIDHHHPLHDGVQSLLLPPPCTRAPGCAATARCTAPSTDPAAAASNCCGRDSAGCRRWRASAPASGGSCTRPEARGH